MLDYIRNLFRKVIHKILKRTVFLTGNTVSPNKVTIIGALLHVPIAYAIATDQLLVAGLLLIVIGLLDTVDGELARLQKKESNVGIFLDASTDRIKEVLIYAGIIYLFSTQQNTPMVVLSALGMGGSLSVSYIKAKAEMILATTKTTMTASQINRIFQDGLMRVEVRTTLIIIGLIFSVLLPLVIVINTTLTWFTAIYRLYVISKRLT